jgi:hypothetical protein
MTGMCRYIDGSVKAEGVDLQVLEVGQSDPLKHGQHRHERMLQKGEFDICELSLSNYLVAKSRGMPFTAIPIFPPSFVQPVANVGECRRRNHVAAGFDWQEVRAEHFSNDLVCVGAR